MEINKLKADRIKNQEGYRFTSLMELKEKVKKDSRELLLDFGIGEQRCGAPNDVIKVLNEELFFKVIKFSFLQKRKTLINSLSNSGLMPKDLLEEMLNDLGIDLRVRAEQLSLEEFAKMTDYIKTNIQE